MKWKTSYWLPVVYETLSLPHCFVDRIVWSYVRYRARYVSFLPRCGPWSSTKLTDERWIPVATNETELESEIATMCLVYFTQYFFLPYQGSHVKWPTHRYVAKNQRTYAYVFPMVYNENIGYLRLSNAFLSHDLSSHIIYSSVSLVSPLFCPVERKRRDYINSQIVYLSSLLPPELYRDV